MFLTHYLVPHIHTILQTITIIHLKNNYDSLLPRVHALKRLGSLPAWEWDYYNIIIIVKMHSLQIMRFFLLTRSLNLLAQKRHRQENCQRQSTHVTQQMIVMISLQLKYFERAEEPSWTDCSCCWPVTDLKLSTSLSVVSYTDAPFVLSGGCRRFRVYINF